jgi:hypothetical protein
MANSNVDEIEAKDEENALLPEEPHSPATADTTPLNVKLWLSIGVNTLATIAIVRLSI